MEVNIKKEKIAIHCNELRTCRDCVFNLGGECAAKDENGNLPYDEGYGEGEE